MLWPQCSDQIAFYNKYIAPHPVVYGNRFDVYGRDPGGRRKRRRRVGPRTRRRRKTDPKELCSRRHLLRLRIELRAWQDSDDERRSDVGQRRRSADPAFGHLAHISERVRCTTFFTSFSFRSTNAMANLSIPLSQALNNLSFSPVAVSRKELLFCDLDKESIPFFTRKAIVEAGIRRNAICYNTWNCVRHLGICNPICVKLLQLMCAVIAHNSVEKTNCPY